MAKSLVSVLRSMRRSAEEVVSLLEELDLMIDKIEEELESSHELNRQLIDELDSKQNSPEVDSDWINKYKGKQVCRTPSKDQARIQRCFEQYYGLAFNPAYCDWNINHATGLLLELDGYCDELDTAFEYNTIRWHYGDQRARDEQKKFNCEQFGVKLFVIRDCDINPRNYKSDEDLYEAVKIFIESN